TSKIFDWMMILIYPLIAALLFSTSLAYNEVKDNLWFSIFSLFGDELLFEFLARTMIRLLICLVGFTSLILCLRRDNGLLIFIITLPMVAEFAKREPSYLLSVGYSLFIFGMFIYLNIKLKDTNRKILSFVQFLLGFWLASMSSKFRFESLRYLF